VLLLSRRAPASAVRRYAARLAVAIVAVAAVGLGAPVPAQAATCSSAHGVSIVVDFHQLGGGVQTRCDPDGAGESAWTQVTDVGFQLTPVQRQPGFVCRVDGLPDADADPCVNTPPNDAYWSLWWSDGKSGKWAYSSLGAGSLKVPEGGYVGLSWQGQDAQVKPGAMPTAHPTSRPSTSPTKHPSPSTDPSTEPGGTPSSAPGSTTPSSAASSTAPQKVGRDGTSTKHPDPSKAGKAPGKASHGPDATQAGEPSSAVVARTGDVGGTDGGGLPGWVAPLAVAVLFVGAGTIALVRRKGSGGP
jgi:hypothetical protein